MTHPREVADLPDRPGSSAGLVQQRLEKLRQSDRVYGVVFATDRSDLRRVAAERGVSRVANLKGCRG